MLVNLATSKNITEKYWLTMNFSKLTVLFSENCDWAKDKEGEYYFALHVYWFIYFLNSLAKWVIVVRIHYTTVFSLQFQSSIYNTCIFFFEKLVFKENGIAKIVEYECYQVLWIKNWTTCFVFSSSVKQLASVNISVKITTAWKVVSLQELFQEINIHW